MYFFSHRRVELIQNSCFSWPLAGKDDLDAIDRFRDQNYYKQLCEKESGRAMYIDARTVKNGMIPWDETDDVLTKVSPQYVFQINIIIRDPVCVIVQKYKLSKSQN